MSSNSKPLYLVGVPTNGMHSHFFTNFLLGLQHPTNFNMIYRTVPRYEVGDARNILVQEAINYGCKYVFFVDEDTWGAGWGLRQLLYRMETHPEWTVCGGVYCTKTIPPEPLIFKEWGRGPDWGWKLGELIKVKSTGAGFHLFRVSDLAALTKPEQYLIRSPWTGQAMVVRQWFKTGKDYLDAGDGITTLEAHTEDSWLYAMLEEAGMQVWIDTSIQCQHYDKEHELIYQLPLDNGVAVKPDAWNRTPRVINLGAGANANPYEVNVDLRDDPAIHFKCDVRKLPHDWANTFDRAKAQHVLEHFDYAETEDILREWVRLLKPGGVLELFVPDLYAASEEIIKHKEPNVQLLGMIYGDEGHPYWQQPPYGGEHEGRFLPHSYAHNHHKSGFTVKSLGALMQKVGLVNINGERRDYEIHIEGTKPDAKEETSTPADAD